jgi:hypothetical protein
MGVVRMRGVASGRTVAGMVRRLRVGTSALAVTMRVGVVVMAAVVVAVAVNPLAGAVIAAVGLVIAVTVEAVRPAGELRAAQQAPHPHGGSHHLLVVADAPLAGEELTSEIVRLAGADPRLDVLAPTLVSRIHYVTTDEDAEAAEARQRLESSLVWARSHGFEARGEVGPDEPVTAIADELREFGAEAILIVTDGSRATRWAEELELERARAELDIPVTRVVVAAGGVR